MSLPGEVRGKSDITDSLPRLTPEVDSDQLPLVPAPLHLRHPGHQLLRLGRRPARPVPAEDRAVTSAASPAAASPDRHVEAAARASWSRPAAALAAALQARAAAPHQVGEAGRGHPVPVRAWPHQPPVGALLPAAHLWRRRPPSTPCRTPAGCCCPRRRRRCPSPRWRRSCPRPPAAPPAPRSAPRVTVPRTRTAPAPPRGPGGARPAPSKQPASCSGH